MHTTKCMDYGNEVQNQALGDPSDTTVIQRKIHGTHCHRDKDMKQITRPVWDRGLGVCRMASAPPCSFPNISLAQHIPEAVPLYPLGMSTVTNLSAAVALGMRARNGTSAGS